MVGELEPCRARLPVTANAGGLDQRRRVAVGARPGAAGQSPDGRRGDPCCLARARARSNHWGWDLDDPSVRYAEATTPDLILDLIAPMASFISADDRNEVARRALVQVLALRTWQKSHAGKFPDRLDSLVPDELDSLPKDPYSGGPFRYVRSRGDDLHWRRTGLGNSNTPLERVAQTPAPDRGCYTAWGPMGRMTANTVSTGPPIRRLFDDIVFELPPLPGAPAAEKVDAQGGAKDRPVPVTPP